MIHLIAFGNGQARDGWLHTFCPHRAVVTNRETVRYPDGSRILLAVITDAEQVKGLVLDSYSFDSSFDRTPVQLRVDVSRELATRLRP